ncbi:MAG: class I adenylate-forming enzyme family protein [Acidimicrobiia bacterium]
MDVLATAAAERPDAPALITATRTVGYAELDQAASGVAAIVASSGTFGTGAVAFWGERTIDSVAAVWGIPRAGIAAVPVDPKLPPAEAMALTRSAGVRGLWIAPEGGFDTLVERGSRWEPDFPRRSDHQYVLFTSGSEGLPKGVRLDGDNIAAAVAASRHRLGNERDDPWLCVLPLFHVGGLSVLWRQAEAGAPVVLLERFEAAQAADAFGSVAFASLVPVMLGRALAASPARTLDLKAVLVGGAASAPDLLIEAQQQGIPAVPTYGMTETCSQVATPHPNDELDGSVGRPLPGVEVRTVDAAGEPTDGEGRIQVRGPIVMRGYVGDSDRSTGDWFETSDLGKLDDTGRLTVIGRADEVLIVGGENVHPAAVERLLGRHDDILRVRVFGVPDAEWGTRIVAEVETGGTDVAELEAWAAAHLSPPMRPREWRLVEEAERKLDA